jgi:hypothetical protein
MKTKKDVKQLVKQWRVTPRVEIHKRTLTAVLKAHSETQKTKASEKLNIGRIIMKSKITKLAVASVAIIIGIFLLFGNGQETLYSQVIKALEQAHTIHVVMQEHRDQHFFKEHEIWYDREQGIHEEERFEAQTQIRIDNKQFEWRYTVGDKLAAKINSYRDQDEWAKNLYEWLRFNPERDPSGDKVIDGVSCDMYALSIPDGNEKVSVWVNENNRVLEFENVEQRGGQKIRSVATIEYDIEIDKGLFLPHFDSNVEIVGPRELVEEQFPLDTAIFKRENLGFVFAVHEFDFGSGFKYLVCSNRLTEQTRNEISNGHPWTYYGGFRLSGRYDKFGMYLDNSDEPILLARMKHDGISIAWYILVPGGSKAKHNTGCDIEVRANMANQLAEKLKAEGLPIIDKFRLNIAPGESKEKSLSLKEIANQIYSLGEKFDPIVHSFGLAKIVTEPDGNRILRLKKPGVEMSEKEFLKDIENRVEYYQNLN